MRNPATLRVRNNATVASSTSGSPTAPSPFTAYTPFVCFNQNLSGVSSSGLWRIDGHWVDVEVQWRITGAVGAGTLLFTLPAAVAETGINCGQVIGSCMMIDQGTGRRVGEVFVEAATNQTAFINVQGGGFGTYIVLVQHDTPWSWTNNDGGVCNMRYRALGL